MNRFDNKNASKSETRTQGSLDPSASLQDTPAETGHTGQQKGRQGSLDPAMNMQSGQERGWPETQIKNQSSLASDIHSYGTHQEPPYAESGSKTIVDLTTDKASDNRHEKAGYSKKNTAVIGLLIVLILGLAGAAVWMNYGRFFGQSSEKSPRLISDSWEEIIASAENGSYIRKYHIGDTKQLDLGEKGLVERSDSLNYSEGDSVIEMELVALDSDELADGSGKAHMTWIAKNLNTHTILAKGHKMNEKGMNYGGWPDSDMRVWLRGSVLPLLPDPIRSNIKEVKKYSYTDRGTFSSVDTIWIPSRREIYGPEEADEDAGADYTAAFPDNESRKEFAWGWLRSASKGSEWFFYQINRDGLSAPAESQYEHSVYIGFCF